MNNVFKKSYIGNICDINLSTYSLSENWKFVNYLDTGNITKNKIENVQYIDLSVDKLPSRARRKVKQNNIIYSTVRPNQMHYGIIKRKLLENFLVSTGFAVLDVDSTQAEPYFVYYSLIQDDNTTALQAIAEQSTSAYPSIKPSDIKNREILLPPLETQQKIASILSSIDDKIELNNSINNNLEQQAQAIFKSWFVDVSDSNNSSEKFGKFPQLATELTVGDIEMLVTDYVANGSFASLKENVTLYQEPNYAYFVRNTDLKTNTFNVFVDEHSYKFLSKSTLYGNEIIISNVGDVGSVFLCPKLDLPMTLGNNIIMLRPKDNRLTYYLYIWFKWSYGQNLIQGIKGGSAQPKFNKTDFKSLPIIIPQGKLLDKFSDIMTPIFNSIKKNNEENKFLIQLRDTILPKLMNGEIDVSKVNF